MIGGKLEGGVGNFLLVDAQAVALDGLAAFSLAGEDVGAYGERLQNVARELGARQGILRHVFEHGEEGAFVERLEGVYGTFAEEHLRGGYGVFVFPFAVDHDGDFAGQEFLELAALGCFPVGSDGRFDSLAVEHREDLDVTLGIGV